MASFFDSFNHKGDQNDPTMQHVQYDYGDAYISGDTSFPRKTLLPQENFSSDNNMHSSEGFGFGMPSPSTEFASPFESDVFETNGGGGSNDVFISNGPLLPKPDAMQELGVKFQEWLRQNALHLEEKEKREKEMITQIIKEAEEYIRSFL